MGILENAGMLTAGNNQYLQPGYLSSIPSQLDSKKSPLALLAQTCSSIGDSSTKPNPSEKKKEGDDIKKEKSTPATVETTRRSPAFRPYENTTKREISVSSDSEEKANGTKTPSKDSNSVRTSSNSSSSEQAERIKQEGGRTSREAATSSASPTPIIRSGLEVLAGYPKDLPLGTYRSGLPQSILPPGYQGLENHPAFRGAHPGLLASLYPTTLASAYQSQAAAAALYSSAGLSAPCRSSSSPLSSPYLSYTRVRLSGGGETVVPVCRDPYCTGCAYSLQNNHLLITNGSCPPSCTQCELAKAALRAMPGLSSIPASSIVPASSLLPQSSSMSAAAVAASLYPSVSAPSLMSGLPSSNSLLSNPLQAHAALLSAHSALAGHRTSLSYPPGAMSPLTAAAARYHPYAKPASALSSLVGSALPPSMAGLSPYASSLPAYPPGFPSPYAGLYPRPL